MNKIKNNFHKIYNKQNAKYYNNQIYKNKYKKNQ